MNSSVKIESLAAALCKAQSEMGGAVKDSANPFFKSKYADLTSVIKAIKQPFSDNGLAYTQLPISSEHGVGVVTRLMHSSGEWIENEYILPLTKKDPQAAGSAITYARRYALQAMAGIPTADDDAESAMLRGEAQAAEQPSTKEQAGRIAELVEQTESDWGKLLAYCKVDSVEQLNQAAANRIIKQLETKLK